MILNHKCAGYDVIGDIHGFSYELKDLLCLLGYIERGGVYRHSTRTALFLGDFIDHGPENLFDSEHIRLRSPEFESTGCLLVIVWRLLFQVLVGVYRQHNYNYKMYQICQWFSPLQFNPTDACCRSVP
mgnify:CR=1 FL=1